MCQSTYYCFKECPHITPNHPYPSPTRPAPIPKKSRRKLNNGPPLPAPPPGKPDPRPFQYARFDVLLPPTPPPKDFGTKCTNAKLKYYTMPIKTINKELGFCTDAFGAAITKCWKRPYDPEKWCKVEKRKLKLPGKCRSCMKMDEALESFNGGVRYSPKERKWLEEMAALEMQERLAIEDLKRSGQWI